MLSPYLDQAIRLVLALAVLIFMWRAPPATLGAIAILVPLLARN
jgi:hypothetical protein